MADGGYADYLLMAVMAVSVSTAPMFVLLSGAPGPAAATWRLVFSTAIIAATAAATRSLRPPRGRALALSALSGVLLAVHFDAWMSSLYLVPVGVSTAIVDSYPALIVVLAPRLLGDRYGPVQVIGSAAAMAGAIGLALGDPSTRYLEGSALAAAGMVAMAGYIMAGRSLRRSLGLTQYTLVAYGLAAAVSALVSVALGVPLLSYGLRAWACFLALALVPMLGGHTVMNYLLARRSALASSIAVLAEPVGASILAYLLFGQRLTAAEAALMAITLAGVAAAST